MTAPIACPSCATTLDHGEVPPIGNAIRVARYVDCECGTITNVQAIRGDSDWTAVACRPKGQHEWTKLDDAKAFYERLEATTNPVPTELPGPGEHG